MTERSRWPFAGLTTALATLALCLAPLASPAHAADRSPVSLSWDAGGGSGTIADPVLASTDPHVPITLHIDVFADQGADDVTLSAHGEGLDVDPASQSLGDFGQAELRTVTLTVRATTAGMHSLSVTASSPGQPDAALAFAHVWAPGDHVHLPAHDSLRSLGGLGWQGPLHLYQHSERVSRQLAFVDGRWAYLGLTSHGVPTCRHADHPWTATHGCVRYAYDHRQGTGIVQIGGLIGSLTDIRHPDARYLFLTGFIPPNDVYTDENPYATQGFGPSSRLSFVATGPWPVGTFRLPGHQQHASFSAAVLTLQRSGHYRLTLTERGSKAHSTTGDARVARRGDLVLRHGHSTEHHTLAITHNANGRQQLWLTAHTRHGLDAVQLTRRSQ